MDKDNKIDWFSFGKSKRIQHFYRRKDWTGFDTERGDEDDFGSPLTHIWMFYRAIQNSYGKTLCQTNLKCWFDPKTTASQLSIG